MRRADLAGLADIGAPHILREYALIADGERGALMGPRGDICWMCFPRWHSDACFSTLIGGQGTYAVTPLSRFVWGGYYEHGLIWCNRWVTGEGTVECREALALPSTSGRAVILRQIRVRDGFARVRVTLDLRGAFGAERMTRLRRDDDGCWNGHVGRTRMTWLGAAQAQRVSDGKGGKPLVLVLELGEGESHDLMLILSDGQNREPPGGPEWSPEAAWRTTEAEWSDRLPDLRSAIAPRDARHAYAVLSGLTSAGGGMVAAATMSLPERARQGRNYDYRYVWIRDQCFAGQAVAQAGPLPVLEAAVRFVAERLLADGDRLAPAYTVDGDPVPDERSLELPGTPAAPTSSATGSTGSSSSTPSAKHSPCLPKRQPTIGSTRTAGGRPRPPPPLSGAAGASQTGASGSSSPTPGPTAVSSAPLGCDGSALTSPRSVPRTGLRWPTRSSPTPRAMPCTPPDTGSDRRAMTALDAALLLPAIRGGIPPGDPRTLATLRRSPTSSPRMATAIASAPMNVPSASPRARLSCAAS